MVREIRSGWSVQMDRQIAAAVLFYPANENNLSSILFCNNRLVLLLIM